MSWLSRFASVFRGDRLNRDLDDEIRFHLDARTEEHTRAGLSIEEASALSRRQFGSPALVRDASRDIKLFPRIESIFRDVAFAMRLWRRNKLVTGAALVSLSLAVGACTAAFSLIDALILRPLPVDDPQTLIYVGLRGPTDARDGLSFNYPLFREMRAASSRQVRLFAVSDQARRDAVFDDARQVEKVYGQWVSGDAFAILGVKPALGRVLASTDDINPGQHPVAVLSYDFWTRRFARNPDVLGRWVTLREKPLQIVGVAAKGFTGVEPGIMTEVWAPTMMWDDRAISDPDTRWFRIWGRMQAGVAQERARTVLQSVFTGFARDQVARRSEESRDRLEQLLNTRVHLRSAATGPSGLRESFARALWVLGALAALVLLVASSNVASLLVARAAARQREMALRASIGAGRGRLIQQALIESGLLALTSCALGAVLSVVATPKIVSMTSTSAAIVRLDVWPDWRVLVFLGGMGILVTFLFGLAPALHASAAPPADALKSGGGRHATHLGVFRPLVAAQIAFSFVVLFVGGLCLASFANLLRTDLGFDASNLALVSVTASSTGQPSQATLNGDQGPALASWSSLLERLEHTPGIDSASLSRWGLFAGSGRNKSVRIPGRPVDAYTPWYLQVSPGFLRTMRIPLVAGRDLEWRDARPELSTAVIVNESFARRYFPGESAMGKRFFRIDGGATLVAQEVIGVAKDAKYTDIREPAPPTVYEPYWPQNAAVVQVRTRLEMGALLAALRKEIPRAHAAFRLADVTPQSTLVDNHLVRDRALALLSAFFSLVASVLVIIGVYGLLSYTVLQRTREIGIRLALGAQPRQIVALVLREIGGMTLIGLVIGGAGAAFTGRFMTALLYEVMPSDTWSIAAPLLALLAAGAFAAVIPARRAARMAPTTALTVE
jgi:putative ABC transport system permease protein